MGVSEVIPLLRKLNSTEKLQVMRFLVDELAQAEEMLLKPGEEYAVWSPYDAYPAADTMLQVLKTTADEPA